MVNTKNKYWIASFAESLFELKEKKVLSEKEYNNAIDSLIDNSKSDELDDEELRILCNNIQDSMNKTMQDLMNELVLLIGSLNSFGAKLSVAKITELSGDVEVTISGRGCFGENIEICGSIEYILRELKKKYNMNRNN